MIYVGGRECTLGFDWSWWQTPRALHGAVSEGHEFCVIKATEGDAYHDSRYTAHVDRALGAGLTVGAYHFARPDWSDGGPYWDGRQEARLFLDAIDARIRFAVLDLESSAVDAARTTDYVLGFWDQVIEDGRYPTREQRLTYVGAYFNWLHAVAVPHASCLWLPSYMAGYAPNPNPRLMRLPAWSADLWPEGWCLWQYTSSGTVAGLHPSDMNVGLVSWLQAVQSGESMHHGTVENTPEVDTVTYLIYDAREGRMSAWLLDGIHKRWLSNRPHDYPKLIEDGKASQPDLVLGGWCGDGHPLIARLDNAEDIAPEITPAHLGGTADPTP